MRVLWCASKIGDGMLSKDVSYTEGKPYVEGVASRGERVTLQVLTTSLLHKSKGKGVMALLLEFGQSHFIRVSREWVKSHRFHRVASSRICDRRGKKEVYAGDKMGNSL